MQWTVNGPDAVYSDTRQACAWLGVGETKFRQLVHQHPWARPWNAGTARKPKYLWHGLTLALLAYALERQSAEAPDLAAEDADSDGVGA